MVIGIVGKKNSGKTTVAEIICKRVNGAKIAFADALKEEVLDFLDSVNSVYHKENFYANNSAKDDKIVIYGALPVFMHKFNFEDSCEFYMQHKEVKKDVYIITYRRMMQWWGTEYRRATDCFYWNHRMLEAMADYPDHTPIIIDDVRFVDEVELIRTLGGLIVKVERNQESNDTHRSEMELDQVKANVVIKNERGLKELERLANEAVDIYGLFHANGIM